MRGFYRGISASYVGSIETALNFVVYENIKGALLSWCRRTRLTEALGGGYGGSESEESDNADRQQFRGTQGGSKLNANSDMLLCMGASAFSKVIAITAAYPHGRKLIPFIRIYMYIKNSRYISDHSTLMSPFIDFCSSNLRLLHLFVSFVFWEVSKLTFASCHSNDKVIYSISSF